MFKPSAPNLFSHLEADSVKSCGLTQRAADKWDSPRFQAVSTPRQDSVFEACPYPTHLRLTQTVRRQKELHMSLDHLGMTATMGPLLQKEVEAQLLNDLVPYGIDPSGLAIDWSNACQEGHCTQAMDGNLEELSSVTVINMDSTVIAEGWMDFIHGGAGNPLFVFWLFLRVLENGEWRRIKEKPQIPEHIWSRLPESTKRLCATNNRYDAKWKVILW